jgi:hypothetical protein
LLLGRPWQKDNYVSIIERKDGTYLEFRDRNTDTPSFEVLVSPSMMTPRNNIGPYYASSLMVQTGGTETADKSSSSESVKLTEYKLQKMLGRTIIAAREASQELDPPLPVETYSPMRQLGAIMLAQLFEQYCEPWEVLNESRQGEKLPLAKANGIDVFKFLVEQEVKKLGQEITGENFNIVGLDIIRFLELAIQNMQDLEESSDIAHPDPIYIRVRIFHHYFSVYRDNFKS